MWFAMRREPLRFVERAPVVHSGRGRGGGGTRWVEEVIAWEKPARRAWTVLRTSVPFARAQVESFELTEAGTGETVLSGKSTPTFAMARRRSSTERERGVIPVRYARDAHAAILRNRLEIFENVGHYPQCCAPERFGESLRTSSPRPSPLARRAGARCSRLEVARGSVPPRASETERGAPV
jgi:hypothetical protein